MIFDETGNHGGTIDWCRRESEWEWGLNGFNNYYGSFPHSLRLAPVSWESWRKTYGNHGGNRHQILGSSVWFPLVPPILELPGRLRNQGPCNLENTQGDWSTSLRTWDESVKLFVFESKFHHLVPHFCLNWVWRGEPFAHFALCHENRTRITSSFLAPPENTWYFDLGRFRCTVVGKCPN